MTIINITPFSVYGEKLITASLDITPEDHVRLVMFANFFGARICRRPPGYIFSEMRAVKFEKLFAAGFCAEGKQLCHPAIPSRMFSCQEALNVLGLAEYLCLTATVQ